MEKMDEKEESLFMIQNLSQLIEPHLMIENSQILTTNYSRLNNSEDNYPSRLLKINLKLLNSGSGEECYLSLVAKTPQRSNNKKSYTSIQEMFKNEVGIYMSAKPALEEYLREKGIKNGTDFFATPYGGRINLNKNSNIVDLNAVLVLENYYSLGFKKVPCRAGFDLDSSKLVLSALAKFHGTFLGLKLQKPAEFNEKVRPYLTNIHMSENDDRIKTGQMILALREKGFSIDVIERAAWTFKRRNMKKPKEPWGTIIHNKTCVKNIMMQFTKQGISQDVKLLDFSESEYNSPLQDVLFFLFSSVELETLRKHLDDLIDFYYYSLIGIFKRLELEDTHLYCRLRFNKELKSSASQREFYRLVCQLYDILGTRPFDDNNKDIIHNSEIPALQDSLHQDRLAFIVTEFNSRGWLYF